MFIERLELKNYAAIKAGMGVEHLKLNIPRNGNRITLLMGENGSGKSAILDQLQPYSTSIGNVRSGVGNTIIEGKQGYKYIRYDVNGTTIEIKHFMTERTTKSYISKNGVELNENGNVTSFKELVEIELNISEDTITLMKLGANTTTFLKMSSSKRKDFAADILSEVNVFLQMYKKANEKFRYIRSVIKSVSGKLASLNVIDRESLLKDISDATELLNQYNISRDTLVGERATLISKLEPHRGYTVSNLKEEIKEIKENINKLEFDLSAAKLLNITGLTNNLKKANSEELRLTTEVTSAKNERDALTEQRESNLTKIQEIKAKLAIMSSGLEVNDLVRLLTKYNRQRETLKEKYKDFHPNVSSNDFRRVLEIFKELERIAGYTNEFSQAGVVDVIGRLYNDEKVDVALQMEFKAKSRELEAIKAKMLAKESTPDNIPKVMVFKKNTGCTCPFENFYNVMTGIDKSEAKVIKNEIREAEEALEYIDEKFIILNNINLIKMTVEANKELVDRLPEGLLDFKTIIVNISQSMPIYNEGRITSFINMMEEYEEMKTLDDKIVNIQSELNKLRSSTDVFEMLNKDLLERESSISSIDEKYLAATDKVMVISEELNAVTIWKEELEFSIDLYNKSQSSFEELKEMKDKLNNLEDIYTLVTSTIPLVTGISDKISRIDRDIDLQSRTLETMKKKLASMNELEGELATLNNNYEKITLIRESLSSKEGMPLLYIDLFMADINSQINNLISRVYGDKLEVQKFIIDETQFTIPYTSNGVLVKDISMVSQGEESFVSLAISFAFINRALEEQGISDLTPSAVYNIVSMDELDGPLDKDKRHHYLDIIEEQINKVGAEQVFLTSHNDVFTSYHCNAIVTSPDIKLDNYRNMSVIFKVGGKDNE